MRLSVPVLNWLLIVLGKPLKPKLQWLPNPRVQAQLPVRNRPHFRDETNRATSRRHECRARGANLDPRTQPLEPILFPKLRICFVDFPYLHYSIKLEASNLGDLWRLWVRTIKKITYSPRVSRAKKWKYSG